MARDRRKPDRSAAVIGGGALLAWLLLRGEGWRLGRRRRDPGAATRRVHLRVSDVGITADGVPVTVEEAVATARAVGAAEVRATGAARQGTVDELLAALRDAGVQLWDAGAARA